MGTHIGTMVKKSQNIFKIISKYYKCGYHFLYFKKEKEKRGAR